VRGLQHPVVGMIPVADIVANDDNISLTRELAEWCRARLSAYKVPARFIRVDALERTASGKVRRT
jgi:acyl-CoA synthetase (AMP-forming)/AMP-acid ligase II